MGSSDAPFFMAITITTINPPAVVTPLAWDWQLAQIANPFAAQPPAPLDPGLATGAVGTAGTTSATPTYTVTGVNGLVGAGGASANGTMLAGLVAGAPLTVTGNGTSGATNKTAVATTGGKGTGLTVNLIATGGVVAGATVASPGSGYAVGDTITVAAATAGTSTNVTLVI